MQYTYLEKPMTYSRGGIVLKLEEKEKDEYREGTCQRCDGNFHYVVLKKVEGEMLCPTCLNHILGPQHLNQNKELKAINKGMKNLAPRIKKLREQSYKLEVAYGHLFNKKMRIEIALTPVKKITTSAPGSQRTKSTKPLTVEEVMAMLGPLTPQRKAELLKKLGGIL